MRYDVIVLGTGGTGSAVAFHLARRGSRVLALERFGVAHDRGSSHGLTRIIRLAYYEHPSYVPLLVRAFTLWRGLESESGETLLHVTGSVDAGPPGSRVFEGSRRSCEMHHIRHEILSADELTRRAPGYRLPADFLAVWQPDGGFLRPEACVAAHLRLAEASGADIRFGQAVTAWEATGTGVRVKTAEGVFDAAHLVLAAGAWMPTLVPALAGVLQPERQVVGWFEVGRPELFAPEQFPVFVMNAPEGRFYGFPEFDVPGFKLGKYHHRGERVDPDAVDRAVHAEDEAVLRACVARYFPDGAGRLLRADTCLFTNTPDEHFLIGALPDAPQVLVMSACSGHGFKFTSVLGEIAADLVLRGQARHDISLHRLSRFLA
jgi:sarcosine oxidase